MHITLSMTSHRELMEIGELADLRWYRLQLVATELKEKGGDETIASQPAPWTPLSQ